MEETMPITKSPKQVKVHADGCTPDTLELIKGRDTVVFIQSGPKAPTTVHVNDKALFGTTTCATAATAAEATVYTPQTPGRYSLGVTPAETKADGKGAVQVTCIAISGGMGTVSTGSIKVTG
jgi:hypothetical protein